jgi:hypothetical protein
MRYYISKLIPKKKPVGSSAVEFTMGDRYYVRIQRNANGCGTQMTAYSDSNYETVIGEYNV